MRRAALDEDVRPQPGQAAGCIKRLAKKEAGIEEEERVRSKPCNVDALGVAELKRRMAGSEKLDRRQRKSFKRMIVGLNGSNPADANVKLAAFQHRQQGGARCLAQLDLHVRATFPITMEEIREHAIDHLARGSHLQDAGIGSAQQLSSLSERADRTEDDAALAEQLLPLAGQDQPATNAIEQSYSKL